MSQYYIERSTGAGTAIETILGDSGSITGSTVTIYANNAAANSGSSVAFVNAGTISTLNVTDANANTIIGGQAGNLSLVGNNSTFLGSNCGQGLSTISEDVLIGSDIFLAASPDPVTAMVAIGSNVLTSYTSPISNQVIIGTNALSTVPSGNITSLTIVGDNILANGTFGQYSDSVLVGNSILQNSTGGLSSTAYVGSNIASFNTVGSEAGFDSAVGCNILNQMRSGASQQNVYMGYGILRFFEDGSSVNNVILGSNALATLGGGNSPQNNVAIGYQALTQYNDTFALNTTVIGYNIFQQTGSGNITSAIAIGESLAYRYGVCNISNCTLIGSEAFSQDTSSNLTLTACTVMGFQALNSTSTATNTTAIGDKVMFAGISDTASTCVGASTLGQILNGTNNNAFGYQAGFNYTGTESSNIVIGNLGTVGESNVIRIGTQGSGAGQQATCFIAGITGVTVSNLNYVTIDTSTGQLGSVPATNAPNYTNVTSGMSPYTVLATDYYISVDCSLGAVTLNFPNAPTFTQEWIVKDLTGNAFINNITLTTPGGSVTFDGVTSYVMTSNYQAINMIANSTPTYEIY